MIGCKYPSKFSQGSSTQHWNILPATYSPVFPQVLSHALWREIHVLRWQEGGQVAKGKGCWLGAGQERFTGCALVLVPSSLVRRFAVSSEIPPLPPTHTSSPVLLRRPCWAGPSHHCDWGWHLHNVFEGQCSESFLTLQSQLCVCCFDASLKKSWAVIHVEGKK